jgi:hypothetical protein
MMKFTVVVVVDGNDKYMGTVRGYDIGHAYSLLPSKVTSMGKVVLVPIVIES